MNPAKIKKIVVLIPAFVLAILLMQQNYSWIFGMLIGTAIALSSCEMIRKAVSNSFVRRADRRVKFFLIGFTFRFLLFAGLLYLAIVYFKVDVIAVVSSFTIVQLSYPFYLVQALEKQNQHV